MQKVIYHKPPNNQESVQSMKLSVWMLREAFNYFEWQLKNERSAPDKWTNPVCTWCTLQGYNQTMNLGWTLIATAYVSSMAT